MERSKFSIGIQYHPIEEPLILYQAVMEMLLNSEEPENAIALYCLYYYTAKYQKTDIPIATTTYVSNMLIWNPDKVRRIKKLLTGLKLIEDFVEYDKDGKVINHHIKVNLFIPVEEKRMEVNFGDKKKSKTKEEDIYFFKEYPEAKEKTIEKGKERNYKKENEKVYKKEKVIPPNLEWVKEYCQERKNSVDAEAFFNFYKSKGWLVGKVRMKDWHAAIHTWERNGNDKEKFIMEDGLKYILQPNGTYRTKAGKLYIP